MSFGYSHAYANNITSLSSAGPISNLAGHASFGRIAATMLLCYAVLRGPDEQVLRASRRKKRTLPRSRRHLLSRPRTNGIEPWVADHALETLAKSHPPRATSSPRFCTRPRSASAKPPPPSSPPAATPSSASGPTCSDSSPRRPGHPPHAHDHSHFRVRVGLGSHGQWIPREPGCQPWASVRRQPRYH